MAWRSCPCAAAGDRPLRRTLALAAVVAVGIVLAVVIRTPERPRPPGERGHRLLPIAADTVRGLDVTLGERVLHARRARGAWMVDDRPAAVATARALDALVTSLTRLRAIDVFRDRDGASYGLGRPYATIDVLTDGRHHGLRIGDRNAAGSAFYAQRAGDPRILVVGVLLVGDVERVFATRE